MRCYCDHWEGNIKFITGPINAHAIRYSKIGYEGRAFKYCQWCGEELVEEREEGN